ncbi:aldehyde dehydrogenase [Rhizobium leguminosarum]|uniref:aldehyde dehydrogenase n=1 Tax=Rhizobium TaxID=379 RepID=UPI001030E229|nr:aldehyde dehydrogenase [Rhizobium leguminosarum]TBF87495.1 aldehyde dehydrogenase [Rhizobium leguminosarum]TBG06971.1 aldehyde dehydrogenase [Rhizobium leguminosarum]TBG07842.1 aldehyde dehydrogenase [Rhizobium leguminosarum]TBG30008.1 aldehyde dehydrogenase [Rhizobium leguminosarum]TBG50141.1 aldehyde dehydrogenase [Rhizobium leguminosarum]
MTSYSELFIGGKRVASLGSNMIEVRSPFDDSLVGTVPAANKPDIDRAVDVARAAFDRGPWPRMSPEARQAVLSRFLELYRPHVDDFARLIVQENGTPIGFSRLMLQVMDWQSQAYLSAAADFTWVHRKRGMPMGESITVFDPVGVVAAIIPWNAPHQGATTKLFPALLAGCTVILKLAPQTAVDGQVLGELFKEAGLPDGVLSIVAADADVSEYLVRHPGVDKIAFTGSTVTGRRIASLAGEQLKRVSLELGGKSAAIIMPDADVDKAIDGLRLMAFGNNGQLCAAHTRVLVQRDRHDAFVSAFSENISALKIGDPLDPETAIGPLVSERQRQRVAGYIDLGIKEGAHVALGGPGMPDGMNRGAFVRPTLFSNVDNRMRVAREEIFGPVICVIPYDNIENAVHIANDSEYGLYGGVWASDKDEALAVASRLRTGGVSINGALPDFSAPFGGYKQSGIGREYGAPGIAEYTEQKALIA